LGTDPAARPWVGRLVLASRSPQRRAILEQLGIPFEQLPQEVEEIADGDPEQAVLENARRKARAVERDGLVLGVDTEVLFEGELLGKPRDAAQAAAFLERLSGRTHVVLGGLVLLEAGEERSGIERTAVTFRELSPGLRDWYLAAGEWSERAGGYAIQGHGAALVERIEGDFWNVVGLPVPLLLRLAPELLVA
jgi:nucleoside triphosphate pyrophosphatase